MAGLSTEPLVHTSPLPANAQFGAVAWLRWRLFVNSFRRKGATSELVARIVMVPFFALLVVGPILGAGVGAYFAVLRHSIGWLPVIFWGIFALQIIVSINIAQPGLSFDPQQLIRFPVSFPRYLTIRLFLGLLSASTIIGTLALLAAAIGATAARPGLGPIVFAAAVALAFANMLFVRMIFAWVDRWLSTRRAREIFTGLIILSSVGFQYLNVTFNPGFGGNSAASRLAKEAALKHAYHVARPLLNLLPPGFAGSSVIQGMSGHTATAVLQIVGVLSYALIFLAVFSWRMRHEFGGENLSEAGPRTTSHPADPGDEAAAPRRSAGIAPIFAMTWSLRRRFGLSPAIEACLQKEWIYLRRNVAQFYAVIFPLAMVLLFSTRMGRFSHTTFVFPAAIAYSTLGVCALAYNIFGADATGMQFYFLAPVRLRSIVLAKNLFGFFFLAMDAALVYLGLAMVHIRPDATIAITAVVWLLFAGLLNATVGNIRSITTPKKMDPGKISRRQTSQMSALLAVGLMVIAAAIGAGLILLAGYTGLDWLPAASLAVLTCAALLAYLIGLSRVEGLALRHRETLLEELTKAA